MNAYPSETPRFAIAVAALALSALSFGAMVVLPAQFDEGFAPSDTVLATQPAGGPPVEIAIVPARIEVVAVRGQGVAGLRLQGAANAPEPNVAWAMGGPSKPNCKPEV